MAQQIMTEQERVDRMQGFLDDLSKLCGKHGLAIIAHPNVVVEVLTVGDPMEKLGDLLYIYEGRQGYTFSSTMRKEDGQN